MSKLQIKSRLESQELTSNQPAPVQQRLNACLAHDPQHITPGQQGGHVKAIQDALEILRQRKPAIGLSRITDAPGEYGESTAVVVLMYKKFYRIVRPGQPIDNIVGRMTLTQIDNDLASGAKPVPPPEPPPPISGIAGVQIGPLGKNSHVVADYYNNCGLETVGPGQLTISGIRHYSTLEELIDVLLTRPEPQQVIINHGHPEKGMLLQCVKESGFMETGKVMYLLSGLADLAEKGAINPSDPYAKVLLGVADDMRVTRSVVLRLVQKLVAIRKKRFILHLRACNLTDGEMVTTYKKAFGARMITYHGCRLLYIVIAPQQLTGGVTAAEVFNSKQSSTKYRYRLFEDPIGLLSSMLIGVEDKNGHADIEDYTLIEQRSSEQIQGWAEFLLRRWRIAGSLKFVIPVMWENTEITFHCPLEEGWREKLASV